MKDIDGSLILIGRERAGLLTGRSGSVHELAIILSDPGQEKPVHAQVSTMLGTHQGIEVVNWERAMPNLANAIKLDYASQS